MYVGLVLVFFVFYYDKVYYDGFFMVFFLLFDFFGKLDFVLYGKMVKIVFSVILFIIFFMEVFVCLCVFYVEVDRVYV